VSRCRSTDSDFCQDLDFRRDLVSFCVGLFSLHLHSIVNCCLHTEVTALLMLVQVSGRMRAIESTLTTCISLLYSDYFDHPLF
jgi:hypothetical protein